MYEENSIEEVFEDDGALDARRRTDGAVRLSSAELLESRTRTRPTTTDNLGLGSRLAHYYPYRLTPPSLVATLRGRSLDTGYPIRLRSLWSVLKPVDSEAALYAVNRARTVCPPPYWPLSLISSPAFLANAAITASNLPQHSLLCWTGSWIPCSRRVSGTPAQRSRIKFLGGSAIACIKVAPDTNAVL